MPEAERVARVAPGPVKPRFSGRLSRRLLGWFLVFSLVPVFVSNTIGYLKTRQIIGRVVERYLAAVAEVESEHVQDRLERHLSALEMVTAGNEFLAAGVLRLEGRAARNDMVQVASPEAVRRYLGRKLAELRGLDGLYLQGADGTVLLRVGLPAEARLESAGAPAPFARLPDAADGSARFRLAVPIWSGDAPVGLLCAVVGRTSLGALLGIPPHVAGSIESFIVDAQGRPVLVSHPHGRVDYSRRLPGPLATASAGSSGQYPDAHGREVVGTVVSVPGLTWRYIMEVPAADALSPLWFLRWLSGVLELLLLAMVVAAAWFVARGVVAPIRRLVSATRRVAGGDLEARVAVAGTNEIGELSHAFNDMATELALASERVREMHRREIERAQHLATVGELASGVAHEIKNPVMGISNGLDLVKRRIAPDAAIEPIMEEMTRQLARIEAAVRDLLTFARPAAPSLAASDANEVVRRAARLVLPQAERAGVAIEFRLGSELPELLLDEEQLRQALVNLLLNAVQATASGGRITISTRARPGVLEIQIKDTGRGITPQDLDHIFKPFFTTRHSGTGLGLSISRDIVERHGGRIEVHTRVGRGSSFTVVLAAERPPAHAPPAVEVPA